MPGSFLSRHRTICEVLEEIKTCDDYDYIAKLCDEAITYAQAMNNKLMEYKRGKESINPEEPSKSGTPT